VRLHHRFRESCSPGFDPDVHLASVGCANQTTMLSTESFAIGEQFRAAIRARYGVERESAHFRAFDTICSATQDRQDAVVAMLAERALDAMIVIGGYNSSNTCNLARLCAARVPTYHIADPSGLLSRDAIRHREVASKTEVVSNGWLPDGAVAIGLTSGASTPDNLVEAVVLALAAFTAEPARDGGA
jgi:4-hydroxy-3-methylbut-2-en-1-yl diphosphate reductase